MLNLHDVTLCCADTRNHALALRALSRSRRSVTFARTLFFTDAIPNDVAVAKEIEVIPIERIASHADYSRLIMKDLYSHVTTMHVLVVQWDGYVVHPAAWDDAFLACDYIGAPWPEANGAFTVGNGGFSLRSRKLLAALQDERFSLRSDNEDIAICSHHRFRLESEFGIRFGSAELARRFSFETYTADVLRGQKTFGFHGIFNMFAVEDQQEIVELISLFSDAIATSEMTLLLLRNLVLFRQFEAAIALGMRMLQANPNDQEAAELLAQSRDQLAIKRASRKTSCTKLTTLFQKIRFR